MSKLKLAYSRIIPFSGFYCINLFGWLIRRVKYKDTILPQTTYNHELIHTLQAEDFVPNKNENTVKQILGYLIFYVLYLLEWLVKVICKIFYWKIKPYYSISFEQEAYNNQIDSSYEESRKKFAWVKYIFKFQLNG